MLPLIIGGIAAGASLAGAGASWYNAYNNNKNQSAANGINQQSLDWQKQQWNETKEREDNAIQRRVADLKAAGLSPTLAAGSAASASTAPTLPQMTPQHSSSYSQGFDQLQNGLYQLLTQKQQYDKTQAEIGLIEQQRKESEANLINKLAQSDLYKTQTSGSALTNAQLEFNNGLLSARWENEKERFRQFLLDSAQGRKLSESNIRLSDSNVQRNSFLNENDSLRYDMWSHNLLERLQMDRTMNQAQMSLLSQQALETQIRGHSEAYDLYKALDSGVSDKNGSVLGKAFKDVFGVTSMLGDDFFTALKRVKELHDKGKKMIESEPPKR